jgi:hypothetical protein
VRNTIVLTGFEVIEDAASDDVYDVRNIAQVRAGYKLVDNGTSDFDTIKIYDNAIGFNNNIANIDLALINSGVDGPDVGDTFPGLNFDFRGIDVTGLTVPNLAIKGTADVNELIVGPLSVIGGGTTSIEALIITQASVAAGTTFILNGDNDTVKQGANTYTLGVGGNFELFSAGGQAFDNYEGFNGSQVTAVTTGLTITVEGSQFVDVRGGLGDDTVTGGGGADWIWGNGGNDTLSGGATSEVREITLSGALDAAAGSQIKLTFTGGAAFNLTIDEGPGQEVPSGADADQVGSALAAAATASLAAINAGANWANGAQLTAVTYSAATNVLSFTFNQGADLPGGNTIAGSDTDAGSFALSAEATSQQGGLGGADDFVFEKTAAANGNDTINFFGANDNLVFSQEGDYLGYLNGAAISLAPIGDAGSGDLVFAGANNVGILVEKAALSAADIKTTGTAANGEVILADNAKVVVLVTADTDGAVDTMTNNPYLVYFVEDTDSGAAQAWSVTQVATVNMFTELSAAAVGALIA